MPVLETPLEEQACRCGRLKRKIHCPMCGGYTILALGMNRVTKRVLPNGETKEFQTFRCRRCSLVFDDLEWRLNCEAPRFETKNMKQRRLEENARGAFQDSIARHGGDQKAALRELFAKVKRKTPDERPTDEQSVVTSKEGE